MNAHVFRKLRLKIVLIGMCMMVALMLAVCLTVYFAMAASIKSNSIAVLDYTANVVINGIRAQSNDGGTATESLAFAEDTSSEIPQSLDSLLLRNVLIVRYDDSGYIIKVNQGDRVIDHLGMLGKDLPDVDSFDKKPEGIVTINDADYRYKHISEQGEEILLLISRAGELSNLPPLIMILLVVGIGSIVFLILACFVLAGHIIRPISDAWNIQQQFLHDASHELKTPLAVIATNLEAVRASPDETVASQDKWLQYAAEETEEMRQMVNDMLTLAKSEHPDDELHKKPHIPFSLSETVTEAGLIIEANALEAGIELVVDVEDDLWTIGVQNEIKQVLLILLDNALKNTFAGGTITLALRRSRSDLIVSCTNTGHGIPKDELQNIFKRFYRLDSSRARQSGGSGLGLSIAENIIRRHSGKIWAESEVDHYARFLVRLPSAPLKGDT